MAIVDKSPNPSRLIIKFALNRLDSDVVERLVATIGERINQWLKKRGSSQSDMARQLRVAPLTVNNWVNDRNKPRGHNLQKITRLLSPSSGSLKQNRGRGVTIGTQLRQRLKEKAMSQSDAARQLRVAPLTVNNWVNDRNKPRGHNLQKLKRLLPPSSRQTPGPFRNNGQDRQNPLALKFQGGKLHRELQKDLCKLGQTMGFEVRTHRDIGGRQHPDVLWYKLNPDDNPTAQPKYVFEIELGRAFSKSLATLKHAYDLGNADLFLLLKKNSLRTAEGKANGSFHEIQRKLKILPIDNWPKDIHELKEHLGVWG